MAKSPKEIAKICATEFENMVEALVTETEKQLVKGIEVKACDSYSFKTKFSVIIGGRAMGENLRLIHPVMGRTVLECVASEFRSAGWKVNLFNQATEHSESTWEFIG